MDQLVLLDNDLRRERECGIPRSIKLPGLDQLKDLPQPWHREFWNDVPDDLPFNVKPLPKPITLFRKPSISTFSRNASKRTSMISNGTTSEWEWEYYSQSEEDDSDVICEE